MFQSSSFRLIALFLPKIRVYGALCSNLDSAWQRFVESKSLFWDFLREKELSVQFIDAYISSVYRMLLKPFWPMRSCAGDDLS